MQKPTLQDVSDPSKEPLERRRAQRHLAWMPAYVALPTDGVERLCVTHDISRHGGMVLTQFRLTPGEEVTLEMFLTDDTMAPTVRRAEVLRVARRQQPNTFWTFDTALRFSDPMDAEEPEVEAIAERQKGWWQGA
jgi:hypothetical protein